MAQLGHVVSTQYASSKHIGKVAAVMDLLDDYWFYHSTLFTTTRNTIMLQKQVVVHAAASSSSSELQKKSSKQRGDSFNSAMQEATCSSFVLNQKVVINLPSSSAPPQLIDYFPSSQQEHKSSQTHATRPAALLLRNMPTEYQLPVRRHDEYPTAALPCYTKLRHSMSALDSSSSKNSTSCTNLISSGAAGDGPPRHMIIKLEKTDSSRSSRYSTMIRHYIAREAYYRKTFKEKKWRSLGDLDYIETQGLKDLGFVLDKEGRQIMNRDQTSCSTTARPDIDAKDKGVGVMRPYDLAQRSAPPMFRWVNRKSADDMKDQLKFWAKAVAFNTKLHDGSF